MEHLKIVRKINEHSKKNYDKGADHLHFLEMCNKSLFEYFKNILSDRLVYSTLAYKSNVQKTFEIVKGYDTITGYNFGPSTPEYFKESLKLLLIESQDKDHKLIINLTNILLKENSGNDLFFVNKDDDYLNYFTETHPTNIKRFPLGSMIFKEDINEFESSNLELTNRFFELIKTDEFDKKRQYSKYLWHYKKLEQESKKSDEEKFYIHFIRPTIVEFDYNLLLALATKRQLTKNELAFIDLILYRIVGQTAVEKERIKTNSTLSTLTHGLKTEYKSILIGKKDDLKFLINSPSASKEDIQTSMNNPDIEMEEHKKLTGVISLIEKMQNGTNYINSGKEENLLVTSAQSIILKDYIQEFNKYCTSEKRIQAEAIPEEPFQIVVEDGVYFSKSLLRLLLDTILENALMHGLKNNNSVILKIRFKNGYWIFENKMNKREEVIDVKTLTGNLRLYQLLFINKSGGEFEINNGNYNFKIKFK